MPRAQAQRLQRLFLWANSGCNSRCKMCDIWKERPGQRVTPAQVRVWAPEWRRMSVATVILCGESLLHPDLWEIARAIRAEGIKLDLLSNGYLLYRHAERVVEHCDVLRVSLDGPREVHNVTRGLPTAYEKLRRGVGRVRAISPRYPISGRCAVHRLNFRHLRATVAAAHELGLDSISFSATDVSNEEAFRRFDTIDDAYVTSLLVHADELDELADELDALADACAEDFRSGFIEDSPEDLRRNLHRYYVGMNGLGELPEVCCNAPWTSAVIEYDGTVRPCFPLPAYGSIGEHEGLSALLDSSATHEYRDALNVHDNPVCRTCVCQTLHEDPG
jgi:Fe-coproporphyrin III synthase